jgi:hypothetical protein
MMPHNTSLVVVVLVCPNSASVSRSVLLRRPFFVGALLLVASLLVATLGLASTLLVGTLFASTLLVGALFAGTLLLGALLACALLLLTLLFADTFRVDCFNRIFLVTVRFTGVSQHTLHA